MNSKSIIWAAILLLLSSSFIPFSSSQSNIFNTSIQELIDNANDRDTIYIPSGIYYEHIVVDKPLTIVGEKAENTIVDGMEEDEHIFNVISENVEITGFTIMNCSIGFSGIRVNNDNCDIHNNIFKECGGGIEPRDVEDINILNNTIKDNTWGIYIHGSINCSIIGNTISNNVYGIELGYSTAEIKNNVIRNNDFYGLLQIWCNQISIKSNNFSYNGFAIQTYNSNDNIIRDNYVNHNNRGISLFSSSNNQIRDNTIHNNNIAVYIWREANNNQIKYNEISLNSIGINIADSNYNNISDNNISRSYFTGKSIGLIYSSNNTISNNNIIGYCYDGVELIYSPYNSIINNNISNHLFHGIHLISSPYTTIKDNIFNRNTIRIYQGELYSYSEVFQNLSVYLNYWNTHTIENNTISGKKLLYYKNLDSVAIPKNFGELIFANCSNITIENCDITNVDCGIQIGFSKDIQIINNTISNISRTGMAIAFSSNVLIKDNNITDFNNPADLWGAGIDLFYLEGENKIIGNNVIRTGVSIWIIGTNNTLIAENTFKDSLSAFGEWGGINLFFSNNNSIIRNDISGNQIGIYLNFNSNDQLIQSNNINNNSITGIAVGYSDNSIISKNNITDNAANGILIYAGSNNIISKNVISYNKGNGIFINNASNNNISNNNVSNNEYPGVALGYSSNRNQVLKNIIFKNKIAGIVVRYSSNNNNIIRNIISYSDNTGISIGDASKNNKIRENNIIGHKYNSFFRYSFPNFWINNYWDDWDKPIPYLIYGEIKLERLDIDIPWIQFDWKPATEPYDII